MGWRYVVITLGAVSVFVWICRFVIFRFRESPKFLLSKGKLKEAVECLDYLGKVNKNANRLDEGVFDRCEKYWTRAEGLPDFGIPGLRDEHKPTDWNVPDPKPDRHVLASMLPNGRYLHTLTAWEKIKREAKRNKILWHAPFLRLAISVWLIYAFDFWGFAIAGNFLPTILLRKNADLDISLTQTYKDYIIIYAPGILGVAFGAFLGYDPRIGRKWAMVGCATIMALMLFLFAVVNDRVSNITLNCLEYFFQSAFNAVLYGWTPETFPSAVRGTASGAASFWGRLFSIVAPLAATKLLDRDLNGPLYLAGAGVCVAVLVLLSIPGLFFRREFLKSIG